jgi:hypothetical protein
MIFKPDVQYRGKFKATFNQEVIKNEPMFFNSNLDYAYNNGGPITKEFIDTLPWDWVRADPVLDSRVHMLMKDWYPCIPGWHHDDVPRTTLTGQPNYINPEYHSEHLLGLVNGDICPTKFLTTTVELSEPDIANTLYEIWHKEIENIYPKMLLDAPSGIHVQFNNHTFHTGTKAKENGWRWFCRLSRNTDRQKSMTNEIRRQVQVYLENPIMGW